ncbi:MAG: hypothetical protein LQ340_006065 [Diploschistes diacapsis]|nr:MAG: hypothetical protein LQ340_006065 [Diploschistes diacapsis]
MVKPAPYAVLAPVLFLGLAAAIPTGTTTSKPDGVLDAPLSKRTDHYGEATYYYQGGAAGSCGNYNSDQAYIAALSTYWMDQGTFCGRTIDITNNGGGDDNNGVGQTITVTVADTCEGCDENHIDLSVGAFEGLTGGNLDPPGEFNIVWHFNA